jgi:hypothetical protein
LSFLSIILLISFYLGTDREELKEVVKIALKEVEAEKECSTIAFSMVSNSKVKSFLKSINIIILEEQLDAVENNLVSFQPFQSKSDFPFGARIKKVWS